MDKPYDIFLGPLDDHLGADPLAHPFLRPAAALAPPDLRRKNAARATSWALVGLLHVFLFFFLVITFRPFADRNRPLVETLLLLPSFNGDQSKDVHAIRPDVPNTNPQTITTAPIILPRILPPPPDLGDKPLAPGDILGAVGRELACSAGSWEHLTGPERQRCGGMPWRGMRLPNGSLVMVPPSQLPRLKDAPPQQFDIVTGQDRNQRDLQIGQIPGQGGCPIVQQLPCTHVTPEYQRALGNN